MKNWNFENFWKNSFTNISQIFFQNFTLNYVNGVFAGEIKSDLPYARIHEYGDFVKSKTQFSMFGGLMKMFFQKFIITKFKTYFLKNGHWSPWLSNAVHRKKRLLPQHRRENAPEPGFPRAQVRLEPLNHLVYRKDHR